DTIPIPLRLSAPVGTPNASSGSGLPMPRAAATPAHRPAWVEKVLFDYEGLSAMTNFSTPTTLAQLVARSRKLGADRSICNWGGGNTSRSEEHTSELQSR